MTPRGYPIGARRLVSEIGFFQAINRLDALVFATGFYAMTGAAAAIEIRGRDGRVLKEESADGPRSYLGLCVAGFPNLFTITGPGSPSVLSNVVLSIEQHVEWITTCLEDLRRRGFAVIQASETAESSWMEHVDAIARKTLFPKANSWYQGRTRDGRSVFMPYVGGVGAYRATCEAIAANGYEGFILSGSIEERNNAR
jgi:cyclohexanone monooxygenase